MSDIESREDVKTLVDTFYAKVLKDETIGYLFTEVAKISLETHMPIMYDFWESVLFGKSVYKGNPMTKHFELNKKSPLLPEHFARWKELWFETLNELFEGERANEAKTRANTIAYLMESKMPKA
ncbi:MAG: group III truncated hemoglobin [Schleiferiaceae bacterium]|jgi:hemoglobin|nr:group III truncated hemoglobin [Schleiferiaceae bacterium]